MLFKDLYKPFPPKRKELTILSFLKNTTGSNKIHRTEWSEEETYYIKCKDEFNNEALGCSIIVKPMDNFL